jgi:hypothetical protein
LPFDLNPEERIQAAKRAVTYLEEWNQRHNEHVSRGVMERYFENTKCMVIFREFALFAPNRWRYFAHRLRFYRYSYPEMNWKLRLVNLMRVLGALVVGYRRRHQAQRALAHVTRLLGALRQRY